MDTEIRHPKSKFIFALASYCHCDDGHTCDFCQEQYRVATIYIKQVKEGKRRIDRRYLFTLAQGLHVYPHIAKWFLDAREKLLTGVAIEKVTKDLIDESEGAHALIQIMGDQRMELPGNWPEYSVASEGLDLELVRNNILGAPSNDGDNNNRSDDDLINIDDSNATDSDDADDEEFKTRKLRRSSAPSPSPHKCNNQSIGFPSCGFSCNGFPNCGSPSNPASSRYIPSRSPFQCVPQCTPCSSPCPIIHRLSFSALAATSANDPMDECKDCQYSNHENPRPECEVPRQR